MVVCPLDKTVVWFCSLHKKPSNDIKQVVQGYDLIYLVKYWSCLYNMQVITNHLWFSTTNVINVLGGRSISSSHTLHWVQPKVFLFLIEPIKFVVDLFNDLTLMKL